jgi:hypothetical protein
MEIKEPAAIFSAEGLKMFIDALKGNTSTSTSDNEVDKLVKEYNEYKGKKDDHENKMEVLTEHLAELFEDKEIKTSEDIVAFLNDGCGFQYELRSITPLMRGVMKRNPSIKKLGKREYQLGMNLDE